MVTKAFMILDFMNHFHRLKNVLPRKTVLSLLEPSILSKPAVASGDAKAAKEAACGGLSPKEAKEAARGGLSPRHRILHGQVVGVAVESAAGGPEPVKSADQCPHPDHRMKMRGNKSATEKPQNGVWWICLDCRSRWYRYLDGTSKEQTESDIMHGGVHRGKTYQQILYEYPQYANWAVLSMRAGEECHPFILRFAQWVEKEQGRDQPTQVVNSDSDDVATVHSWVTEDSW